MFLSNPHMVVPGNRSVISPTTLTVSPSMKSRSPGNFKRYDNGGIGLGIVAELDKSTIRINRHAISYPVCSGSNRTDPVHYNRRFRFVPVEIDLSEEYTCVTKRDGMAKVYYNNDKFIEESPVEKKKKTKEVQIRDSAGFLSWCCLCNKKLQGNDIYMYKGDKGFCSEECRSVKIMEDNLKVQQKSTSVEVLRSPFTGGQISSAGIFVI